VRGACNVHLKLAGRFMHEMPVVVDFGDRQPVIGDLIEVPIGQRKIRARVSYALSAASRDGHAVCEVYAEEIR
jgi:hypothetical protein